MMTLNRRAAIAMTAASGFALNQTLATPTASPVARGLGKCGINYDLGSELARNELTRPISHEQFFRNELTAIREQLHADSIGLFGSNPDQLIGALDIAADLGFDIRLQTRLNFLPLPEMVDRLHMIATEAERVRKAGIPVVLDVGCEYMIFADGMIEGNDFFEKIAVIESGDLDWEKVFTYLFRMLHGLAREARSIFNGPLTYSDTPMEADLWEPFDIIGLDHYLSAESADTYLDTIAELAASGKPVWINEFGATANSGAPEGGGMEWNVVDYEANPPQIIDGVIRDETKQAENIIDTLTLVEQSNTERAYLYEFVTTGAPRSDDPRFDWDLTGYGIVTVWGEDHDQPYESTGYWEPKQAFETVAEWNAR